MIGRARAVGLGRLHKAVRRSHALSHAGLREFLFTWMFSGLVYPQIWEDPEVDMQAMEITPDCHVAAIASGGCNILSYLVAGPARIAAIDLNRTHVALNRLKLAAARGLPDAESFYRFFGAANDRDNIARYRRCIASHLDADSRAWWEGRSAETLWAPRIAMFARNVYRYGLLGRFVGLGHLLARVYGVDLCRVLQAGTRTEQRARFDAEIALLFDKPLVRRIASWHVTLFGLGIPPAQYESLAGGRDMICVLRERMQRLVCDFDFADNYFAWQALARRYAGPHGALPPYLQRQNFETIRARVDRVEVVNGSFTNYLQSRPQRSLDRYVLLDAQDWMTDAQLNSLWREIARTAKPDARVIFRTAAKPSLLPGRLDPHLLARWRYAEAVSRQCTARDRSAIYGGFHLYVLEG